MWALRYMGVVYRIEPEVNRKCAKKPDPENRGRIFL
jgi:hypothetical protein